MTKKKTTWTMERNIALFSGQRKYRASYNCDACDECERLTYNNACVRCKKIADFKRLDCKSRYSKIEEVGTALINEEANREFLSALAKEKAHSW